MSSDSEPDENGRASPSAEHRARIKVSQYFDSLLHEAKSSYPSTERKGRKGPSTERNRKSRLKRLARLLLRNVQDENWSPQL